MYYCEVWMDKTLKRRGRVCDDDDGYGGDEYGADE